MTNCKVENSTIGSGDITFGSSSVEFSIGNWHVERTNKYCVGGLVGYLGNNSSITNKASTNLLENCSISNDSTVRGGKVKYKSGSNVYTDSDAAIFAGGVIGYNEGIASIGSDLQTSCTVSGYDNVGGIIGYNQTATIQNLNHTGALSGTGENIGGIVGTNTGGNISNCNNNSAITGSGKNVGGITGLNNGKNITNCYNNANVIGDKNVGGIAGITYAGWIDYCGNNSKIEGKDNENYTVGNWYFTAKENCTGTGGIVGKLYQATISKSFNNGEISCNFNGGGLTGLIYGGTIKYSYNSGTVTNQSSSQVSNRLGGIAGAGNTVSILCCYNKGTINGKQDINVLSNGLGGIIGTVVDNSYFVGTEEIAPISKYTEFTIPVLVIRETRNSISSCYNSGAIIGGVPYEYTGKFILWDVEVDNRLCHSGGIVGCVLWAPNSSNIQLTDNCYINNVEMGASDSWSNEIASGVSKKTSTEMKDKLNSWASSNPIYVENISGQHVYNTTHPFRQDLGYTGYGVLWWQFETCTVNFTITKKQNSTNNYNPVFVTAPTVTITTPSGENVQNTNCIAYTAPVRSSDGTKYTFTLTAPKGVQLNVNVAEGRDYYAYNNSTYTLSNDDTQNKQIELSSKEIYKVKSNVYGYESTEYTANPKDITGNATNIELISRRTSTGETTTKTGAASTTIIDVYAGEQVSARVTNTITGYGSCTTQTFDIPDNATWNASEKVYYITTKMYARQVNLQVNVYGPSNSQVKNIKKEDVVINVTTPYRNSQTLTVEWPGNGQNIAICYGSSVTVKAKAQHYDNSSGTNYGEQTATASNITSDKTINLSLTPHVYSVNNYTPSSTASATVKGGLFNSIRSQWTTIGSGTRTERLRKGSGAQTGTRAEVHGSYDATLTFNATRPSIPEGMSIKNCSIYVRFNITGLYINGSAPNLYSNDLHLYFNDTYKSNRVTSDDYTELKIYSGDWPTQMVLKFVGKASLNTTETFGSIYEFWIEYTYGY